MKRSFIAWTLLGLVVPLQAAAALLPDPNNPRRGIIFIGVAIVFTSACGALIAARRPDNAVGWILTGIALSFSSGYAATQYAQHALVVEPGSLPGGLVAAWLQSWLWTPLLGLLALLVLLFPTGRVPSQRFKAVMWVAILDAALLVFESAFRSGPLETFHRVTNPVGFIPAASVDQIEKAFIFLTLFAYVGAVASLVVRFRRSPGTEREQIKWFLLATLSAVALVLTNPLQFAVLHRSFRLPLLHLDSAFVLPVLGFLLLPTAIAISVLRYRLYDIDRIISRTVSYALVTTVLVGGYVGLVVVFQSATRPLTGRSDLAVAASTLIVAALFVPLRRRVQNAVDHRFNRRRYNAEHTIDAFSARLRDEVDIDTLGAELQDVVARTMQPANVSLWVREGPA